MKLLLIVSLTIISWQINFGQSPSSIKDYFIPEKGRNLVLFCKPNTTEISRRIFYKSKDAGYETFDANFLGDDLISTSTNTILITKDKVELISCKIWSAMKTNSRKITYNPVKIILRMPQTGKSVSWDSYEGTDQVRCTASWVKVSYNETERNAIKLVKKWLGSYPMMMIEYYVKGIGLWETDIMNDKGDIKVFEKISSLKYDENYFESGIHDIKYSKNSTSTIKNAGVDASFVNGINSWNTFLAQNLNVDVPENNNAPLGTYQVIVKFNVGKDGIISDIKSETNYGYGMEQEAIRVIKNSPKWWPAGNNGNVDSYISQVIPFVVDNKKNILIQKHEILDTSNYLLEIKSMRGKNNKGVYEGTSTPVEGKKLFLITKMYVYEINNENLTCKWVIGEKTEMSPGDLNGLIIDTKEGVTFSIYTNTSGGAIKENFPWGEEKYYLYHTLPLHEIGIKKEFIR